MRIIAGRHRGRAFRSPEGDTTRPVTDRVKQAIFSHIETRLQNGWTKLAAADLFSGTGSMGLECLSRGAAWCTFVETDRSAGELLRANIADFGFAENSRHERIDLLTSTPSPPRSEGKQFDVLFVDPPFRYSLDCRAGSPIADLLGRLAGVASAEAQVILRVMTGAVVPDDLPGWAGDGQRTYGVMQVFYFRRGESAD